MSKARCTAAGDQRMHRHGGGAGGVDGADGGVHVGHRLHLGQHDVRQALTHLPRNRRNVLGKSRMVDRMHPHRHARLGRRGLDQRHHQRGVLGFGTGGRAVLAIERDVEHAGAELFGHLGLQLQALAHARLDAAVVVAHRQRHRAGLGVGEHLAGMAAHACVRLRRGGWIGGLCARLTAGA
jgi:hypothetical protein